MLRNKITLIVVAIISLFLVGIVNQSDAASITSMSVYTSSDWGGGSAYVDASLSADENIYVIDWYIDNEKLKTTSHYQSPTKSVYENLSTLAGSPLGKIYTIKAVAWFSDAENNTFTSDTDSYSATVYTVPNIDEGYGVCTFSWGHAEVDVGWNGHTAEVTAYGEVYNHAGQDIEYGISIRCHIAELWPGENEDQDLKNTLFILNPPILNIGTIEFDEDFPGRSEPYSTSYTLDGGEGWLGVGDEFKVESTVHVEAYFDIDDQNKDEWDASESETLTIR